MPMLRLCAGMCATSAPSIRISPSSGSTKPATVFAAGFLGDSNFLRGRVSGTGTIESETCGTLRTESALPQAGAEAVIAVRPEKVRLEPAGAAPADGGNRIEGRVVQGVFSGTSVTYIVDTAAGPMRAFRQNAGERFFAAGEAVTLVWSARHSVVVEEG